MEFREIIQSLDRQRACPEVKSVCVCAHLHGLPVRQIQRRVWAHTLVMNAFAVVVNLRITDLSGAHLVKQTSDTRRGDMQNNQ